MSKVVHLSDDAHNRAKVFCKTKGLRMSDWVADLIETAIAEGSPASAAVEGPVQGVVPVQKRKELRRADEHLNRETEEVYSAPPFWSNRASGSGR